MAKAQGIIGSALTATALAVAAPADAATIIQNFNVNSGSSFALQQFDTSLGTLESVDFLLSPFTQRIVQNPSPAVGTADFNVRGFIDLTSSDATAPILPGWQKFDVRHEDRPNSQYQLSVSGPNQITNITTGLNSFEGTSSFNYMMNAGVDILSATAPYGATTRNNGRAAISVTYNFKEAVAAVPEPATWGMMIVGFAAIGASMRARKKGAEPAAPAI